MSKRHRLKPSEPVPHIEGDFIFASFDFSLTCPGFALLSYHANTRSVELLKVDHLSNKYHKNKKNGQIILEISKVFAEYVAPQSTKAYVRERAFTRFGAETSAMFKVLGAMEMILWDRKEAWFQELAPKQIKRLVTGNGKSSKAQVAEALDAYLEHPPWKTDDESDAVAAGVAWLIANDYIDPKFELLPEK